MSKLLHLAIATFFLVLFVYPNVQAQTTADAASAKTFWSEVWQAYQTGNVDNVMQVYTDNAGSITPDGRLQSGKAAMKEDWENFMKMVDETPKFSPGEPNIRLITPDVAIVTYTTDADIKVGGQQVGGKMLGMAVAHKINGKWMLEFDSMTPVLTMPEGK